MIGIAKIFGEMPEAIKYVLMASSTYTSEEWTYVIYIHTDSKCSYFFGK